MVQYKQVWATKLGWAFYFGSEVSGLNPDGVMKTNQNPLHTNNLWWLFWINTGKTDPSCFLGNLILGLIFGVQKKLNIYFNPCKKAFASLMYPILNASIRRHTIRFQTLTQFQLSHQWCLRGAHTSKCEIFHLQGQEFQRLSITNKSNRVCSLLVSNYCTKWIFCDHSIWSFRP